MCVISELRTMRERWNMSQYDLAQIMKTDRIRISEWENGHTLPTTEHLLKWADALGCDLRVEIRK